MSRVNSGIECIRWLDPFGSAPGGSGDDPGSEEIVRLGRTYFTQLDLRVNPSLRPLDSETIGRLTDLRDVLRRRLYLRRKVVDSVEEVESLPGFDGEAVGSISRLMLQLMQSVFGSEFLEPGVLWVIGRTHDLFASGRLRHRSDPKVRVPNNVPDGAAVFLYPEFALLAIEHGIDVNTWRGLLPILIRMPMLYVRAHENDPLERTRFPRTFDEYAEPPEPVQSPGDLDSYAAKLALRLDQLSSVKLGFELGRLASHALCGPP